MAVVVLSLVPEVYLLCLYCCSRDMEPVCSGIFRLVVFAVQLAGCGSGSYTVYWIADMV